MLANARKDAARASRGAVLAVLVIVAGCRSTTAPPPSTNASQSQSVDSAVTTTRAGTRTLQVDPERTVVTVFVRRAGPLARLGHDHVITSGDEAGSVRLGNTPADSSFELTLPVDRLQVDLPAARAAAGLEFAAPVPDDARAGTRHNMLRAEVLDGERYPQIVVRADSLGGTWERPTVTASVLLKGQARRIKAPFLIPGQDHPLFNQHFN